jgi:hypothetical protein
MHSVLPLKLAVTKWYHNHVDCRNVSLDRNGRTKDFIIMEAFSYMFADLHSGVAEACPGSCTAEQRAASGS